MKEDAYISQLYLVEDNIVEHFYLDKATIKRNIDCDGPFVISFDRLYRFFLEKIEIYKERILILLFLPGMASFLCGFMYKVDYMKLSERK